MTDPTENTPAPEVTPQAETTEPRPAPAEQTQEQTSPLPKAEKPVQAPAPQQEKSKAEPEKQESVEEAPAKEDKSQDSDQPRFEDLGLSEDLLSAVKSLGFDHPSQIQALTIPAALKGGDLVGLSQTGTGKTAAFALPILQQLDLDENSPQALILCPTRELCVQVCEEVHRLAAKIRGFRAIPVYGGAPIDRQIRSFSKGVQLIVGTPGRLMDHIRRRSFDPSRIKLVVLDEADRMLDMGFKEDMEEILETLSPERQTLFFSATMTKGVERLISHFGNSPEYLKVKHQAVTVERIEQKYYEVRHRSKVEVLSRLLDMNAPRLAIVFCNTKRTVDEATEALLARGYSADRLHGDITQSLRERVLRRFKEGTVELLVATDVAARGLDVDDVDAVLNYDFPMDPEDYVHRIGRTGRAGRSGWAASFVSGREVYRLNQVERFTKQRIERAKIPSQEDVAGKQADLLFETVKTTLDNNEVKDHTEMVDRLINQGHSLSEVTNALFTLLYQSGGRDGEEIAEDRPGNDRRDRNDRGDRRDNFRDRRDDRRGRDRFDRDDRSNDRGDRRDNFRDRRDDRRDDRRERFDRDGGDSRAPRRGPAPGFTCLFLSVGRMDNMIPGSIAGMIYNETGLPSGSLGKITMFNKHTLIDVADEHVQKAIDGMQGVQVKGRRIRLDYDRRS